MNQIPIIPGRGLILPSAIAMRHKYLDDAGFAYESIAEHMLDTKSIQNNIESFIGSVEIPVGLVGPLLYMHDKEEELVYCAAGTLEGAMVASMNRGVKAVSQSSGFTAKVKHQRMVRAPLFILSNIKEVMLFKEWVEKHFKAIKEIAESHSNHARLIEIQPYEIDNSVHLKFVYTTGDASGQNMTTTCTWYAILWIAENFQKDTSIPIGQFIIEGNGASDKKVSQYSAEKGRGVNVMAECYLKEEAINKVLRTTSEDMIAYFDTSRKLAQLDGMVGYNINVANAIAAIFVATGQDLGSIHESAHGILNLEKAPDGLYVKLTLPSLVIGTVGGGTHLKKQKEALNLMKCYGSGKVERFACLIAGFALALETSTYAAIVSGAFAKAHEKLGRNKPVNWLLRSEITPDFVKKCLNPEEFNISGIQIEIDLDNMVENGIITNLTSKVSKKLIGFIPLIMKYNHEKFPMMIKSKALDLEVINGLHYLAAVIDIKLADLLFEYREKLEYWNCQIKEIALYEELDKAGIDYIPKYWGKHIDTVREIHLFVLENLNPRELEHINTQKRPDIWTKKQIEDTIVAITKIHQYFESKKKLYQHIGIKPYLPWESAPLFRRFIDLMFQANENPDMPERLNKLYDYLNGLKDEYNQLELPQTIIHNDFNSRNIAIRKSGKPCIYDWELAVINIPHRDIVEFLSFVLITNFNPEQFLNYLDFHFKLYAAERPELDRLTWHKGYIYALKEYLITRVSFYEVAGIQARYAFSERILNNSFRMLEILEKTISR
ncbi:MAG: phosphotransferase [Bacteroidales bacterium]|nr:phosphotransferase [Bacteroidales bacterium]